MTVAVLARSLLPALAAKHRRIQVEREPCPRTPAQAWEPAPKRPLKGLDVCLGEKQKEVTNRVIAGKTLQPRQGVQDLVGAQPLRVYETLHGRPRLTSGRRLARVPAGWCCWTRVRERAGVVAPARRNQFGQERDETGQTAKRRNSLGCFIQSPFDLAKERGNFSAARFVQGGLFKHQSPCLQPFPQSDPFLFRSLGCGASRDLPS